MILVILDHKDKQEKLEIEDKKVILPVDFVYYSYNVNLGIKGDTGDPGVRGPRGLTGKIYSIDVFTFKDIL